MDGFGWLDVSLGTVVVASAFIGLWRGVVYEVLSLAGWLIAWWTAQRFGIELGLAVFGDSLRAGLRNTLGWALMFVLVLVAWRLMTWVLQRLLHASPLAPVDRGLGGVFGLARGVVIVLALVMLVGLTPLGKRGDWQSARSVQWAHAALEGLAPVLPGDWHRRAKEGAQRAYRVSAIGRGARGDARHDMMSGGRRASHAGVLLQRMQME